MKFSYSSGQRPLEGYTLKRGIGRGGFGEVYFALSDGGKEVALKLVRGDHRVELRGVAQCLNLKHPNLVALYDLRADAQGDHWVVMEYVAGEPLSTVISRHPKGLPQELVKEWFLGLARAVAYLHDHGIVHRDLKPGNVFIENGTVKVGDYGLSKSISASQHTANTQSVGTVHYMAPEISTGNYNKQIDTYAAGVILYEMLTGRVPFDGESAGEVLMKHLTSPPDLSKLPREWVPVVAKALSKNPAHRYANMAEMARDVEAVGREPLRAVPAGKPAAPPPPVYRAVPAARAPEPVLTALPAVSRRVQVMELCGSMALAVVFAALATALWAALAYRHRELAEPGVLADLGTLFFTTVAAAWAILVPAKFWTERRGDSWPRRIIMMVLGGALGLLALWLQGWSPGLRFVEDGGQGALVSLFPPNRVNEASYFCYYALAFFALRWWRMTARRRAHRFSFAPILAAGFWGVVLLLLVPPHYRSGAVVLVLASAIVQVVSPWEPPPAPSSKRLRLRYA
jgi:eukaryotic-like serine/threonine-protein kinase